jgi:tetratricopeptide (TPR) repeat protein
MDMAASGSARREAEALNGNGRLPGMLGDRPLAEEAIGARIRRLRVGQGKSLRDIEGPGADHAHISRVEAGHRRPTEPFLRTVARNLGVSLEYLRDGEEGSAADQLRARLDDLELQLRLDPGEGRASIVQALRMLHAEAVEVGDFSVARRCRMLIGCSASDRGEHGLAVQELERLVGRGATSPLAEPDVYLSLGRSLAALGRADEAVELFEACLAELEAKAPTDDAAFVRFSTYLSYALADADDLRGARRALQGAVARAEGLDDIASRVRLFYSRARLAWTECDWERGRAYAQRAIALVGASEDVQDLIRMHLLSADIAVLTGAFEDAEESVRQAERHVGPGTDAQDLAVLRCQQALIAARRRRAEDAIALAHEALDLLVDDPATRGRAYWALAEALAADDRGDDALDMFRRAYDLMLIEKRFLPQLVQAWVELLRDLERFEEATDLFISTLRDGVLGGVGADGARDTVGARA